MQLDQKIKAVRRQLKENILLHDVHYGNEDERSQIYKLLFRTFSVGESNSALLIGPRGSGKTKLVKNILNELKEIENFDANCMIVHLNGLLHTDDRLALIAITYQMNLENVVGDKVFGSFAENLSFLLACLRSGNRKTSQSVFFIIEEFDLFCSHSNQTLLYNLFDVSQSAQAPICVLGITCRLDVIELLEKRVKSRFSHRQYFLFPGSADGNHVDLYIDRLNDTLALTPDKVLNAKHVNEWNEKMRKLLKEKKFKHVLHRLLDITLDENVLNNFLISIISSLDNNHRNITVGDFEVQLQMYEKDEVIEQLLDLSILELCLLISMKHHCEIYDNQPMNFEMIYTRYVKFAHSSSNAQNVHRPIVMKAYEHLIGMELLHHVSGSSSHANRVQKEYEMYKLSVNKQQIMQAVKRWQGLPTDVAQWASSSLV